MLTENQLTQIGQWQKKAWKLGIGGIILAVAGGVAIALKEGDLSRLFQPFVMSYILWFGVAAGSLAAVMLHHLAGGAWSFMIQRICEAASRTLPHFFVLGVIILLGGVWFGGVYPWTNEHYLHEHHVVANKVGFLNPVMFTACFFLYFGLLGGLAYVFNKWSLKLDQTGDQANIGKMIGLSAPGLIIYVLTLTFLATHWAMSLEPDWFSTMYPPWLIANYNLTVVAFAVIILHKFDKETPIAEAITSRHYHHLGNFLFGFTIFWIYVSFSQFLIIWNGNIPEEIGWYLHRSGGTLLYVIAALAFGAWLIPLFLLIVRKNKLAGASLSKIAMLILAARTVDIYFNLAPSFENAQHDISFVLVALYAAAIVGIGGLFLYYFFEELKKRPLLAQQDPRRELHFLKDTAHHAHHA